MSGVLSGLPAGLVLPLAAGLAVAVWPSGARARARRRVVQLSAVRTAADARAVTGRGDGTSGPRRASRLRWPRTTGRGVPARLGPDLLLELVACGLRAGLSVADALACAAAVAREEPADGPGSGRFGFDETVAGRVVPGPDDAAYLEHVVSRLRLGVSGQEAWARPPPDLESLARALQLAELSGAPAAAVVARAATDLRARMRERTELAAARLGVRLVLPLGLAVLPGFVLLAVAPIVLGLAASVLSSGV